MGQFERQITMVFRVPYLPSFLHAEFILLLITLLVRLELRAPIGDIGGVYYSETRRIAKRLVGSCSRIKNE